MIEPIRGVEMHYYKVCKRKLWLFHKGIGLENLGHDRVLEGKALHERAYSKMEKDWEPESFVQIDRADENFVREIKLSSRMQEADRLQMLYYLYVLYKKGIRKSGILSYPKEKKTIEYNLDDKLVKEVEEAISNIQRILEGDIPPYSKLSYCSKCAYRDFCQAGED